jgi:hypothetical protein
MIRCKRSRAGPLSQASCAMNWLQAWAEQARLGIGKVIAGGPAHLIIALRRARSSLALIEASLFCTRKGAVQSPVIRFHLMGSMGFGLIHTPTAYIHTAGSCK